VAVVERRTIADGASGGRIFKIVPQISHDHGLAAFTKPHSADECGHWPAGFLLGGEAGRKPQNPSTNLGIKKAGF
jgi:hypothetical protein